MSFRARAGLVLMLLLAASVLLPVASADHAYSHRYIVYGRVVDGEGNAVPGVRVSLGTSDMPDASACSEMGHATTEAFGVTQTRSITDSHGEFLFCYHVHQLSPAVPPTGLIQVPERGYSSTFKFDTNFRMSWVPIVLEGAHANATKDLDDSYLVLGRLWRPAGSGVAHVETIRVYGRVLESTPVDVRIEATDGTVYRGNATTNGYGDFAIRVPTEARVTGGTVVMEADGRTYSAPVDPKVGATAFHAEYPKEADPYLRNLLVGGGVVAGVAVLAGGGFYGFKKVSAAREEKRIRESAVRKRSR